MIKLFFKRAVAYLIDCAICYSVIMLVLQWAILSNTRIWMGIDDAWFKDPLHLELYVILSISLPVWIYFTYFDSDRAKGTFGKWVFRLVVHDHAGRKIGLRKSFQRTFFKLLPWEVIHLSLIFPTPIYFEQNPEFRLITIVGLLLFITYMISILLGKGKQSVYDKLLGSLVEEK